MADYYYDGTDGNDATGDGSEANPYKTVKLSTVGGSATPSGARLFGKRGTVITVSLSLTMTAGCSFLAYGPGEVRPIFDRSGGAYALVVGASSAASDLVLLRGVHLRTTEYPPSVSGVYNATGGLAPMRIDDCIVEGFYNGISFNGGSGHRVTRSTVRESYNNGINGDNPALAACSNTLIDGNFVDGRHAIAGVLLNDAITLHSGTGTGRGNVIRNNIIISGTENCIDVQAVYPGTLIEHNVCYARQDGTSNAWADLGVGGDGSVIRNNLIFSRYRTAVLLTDPNMKVYNNTIICTSDNLAKTIIDGTTSSVAGADIRGNVIVAAAGFSRSMIGGGAGSANYIIKNNLFINYSANAGARFMGNASAPDLATWLVDGNQYVQIPGSLANAWPGGISFAAWKASGYGRDANSPAVLTGVPVDVPALGEVGAAFDTKHPYGLTQDNPMLGAGVECGVWRDAAGRQRPNPPSIGPVDVATLRRVLVTDPAGGLT